MAMEITMDNFEQEVLNSDIPVLIGFLGNLVYALQNAGTGDRRTGRGSQWSLQGRKNRRRQISPPCRSVRSNEHPYRYGI